MIPLPTASEFQADSAIRDLKKGINAAENSNQAGEDYVTVAARGPELYRRVVVIEDLLERCADFLDGYVDVQDGDDGQPEPNKAMRLLSAIREELPAEVATNRAEPPKPTDFESDEVMQARYRIPGVYGWKT